MAITVNGAILRNMPEQISKNVDDIADLETTSENHEARIAALENETILAATFQDCTFTGTTEVQGDLNQTSGDLAVTNNATIGGTLGVTGTVTASNDLDVGGDLSVGVDASVAGDLAVTGAITGGSIIEDMSGYSFSKRTPTNPVLTYKYASAAKNGNKITFVLFVEMAVDTEIATNSVTYLGNFVIPAAVANKLIPYTQGWATNVLDAKKIIVSDDSTILTFKECLLLTLKSGANSPEFYLYNLSALAAGKTYLCRIEVTFLLDDSLV